MDRCNRPESTVNRRQDRFEYKTAGTTMSVFLLGVVAVVALSVVVFLA
jgi:hypothetical protein